MYPESQELTAVRMKVLVLIVLAMLSCSPAGARIVSKCELREQLMLAVTNLDDKVKASGLAGDNLVAKIVCYAGLASEFNTSTVNKLSQERGGHDSRERMGAPHDDRIGLSKKENQLSTVQPLMRKRRGFQLRQSSEVNDNDWILYGIFQLCDGLICSNGVTNSLNICGTDCHNLTDDDITDDISCVLKLLSDLVNNGFRSPHWKELSKVFKLILQEDCKNIQASTYFAECF